MKALPYIIVIIFSYLIGSSSMAYYISRIKGVDMSKGGSGNHGASNALILMGWKAAVAVGIHDIGKALVAVLLAQHFFGDVRLIGAVAGVSSVIGHMFPFYMRFRGGKGFASFLGLTIALNWKLAIIIGVAIVLIVWLTDYIVIGTAFTVVSVPTYLGFAHNDIWLAAVICVATALIILKHRANFVRIIKGTEIGFRRANRGDDRA